MFGEYSVITNSMALTIPYGHFNGELSFIHEDKYTNYDYAKWSNQQLKSLWEYLQKIESENGREAFLELDRFEADIKKGLYFESTIPQGYGIGSSGALVASVYHAYANPRILFRSGMEQQKINKLKEQFSRIESFYHGTSSGIDPLNSYAKYPLLIKSQQEIEAVSIPRNKHFSNGAIFLVDTGKPGKTGPLVNLFMNSVESTKDNSIDKETINEITNQAIQSLISNDTPRFFDKLKILSEYQYTHFSAMIPDNYKPLWKQGLNTGDFFLKLCGSGGGGFLLGFTPDYPKLKQVFEKMNVNFIPVYKNE